MSANSPVALPVKTLIRSPALKSVSIVASFSRRIAPLLSFRPPLKVSPLSLASVSPTCRMPPSLIVVTPVSEPLPASMAPLRTVMLPLPVCWPLTMSRPEVTVVVPL